MGQWCAKTTEVEAVHQGVCDVGALSVVNLQPICYHLILAIVNSIRNTSFPPEKNILVLLKLEIIAVLLVEFLHVLVSK